MAHEAARCRGGSVSETAGAFLRPRLVDPLLKKAAFRRVHHVQDASALALSEREPLALMGYDCNPLTLRDCLYAESDDAAEDGDVDEVLREAVRRSRALVVLFERTNLVKRYMSARHAEAMKRQPGCGSVHLTVRAQQAGHCDVGPLHVNVSDFRRSLCEMRQEFVDMRHTALHAASGIDGRRVLIVKYEDLQTKPKEEVRRVLHVMGRDECYTGRPAVRGLVKASSDDLRQVVANFDELAAFLVRMIATRWQGAKGKGKGKGNVAGAVESDDAHTCYLRMLTSTRPGTKFDVMRCALPWSCDA